MTTSKPYAANDLSPDALRSRSWTVTLAVWRTVPRAALVDEPVLEWATKEVFDALDALVRFEFADELGSRHLQVADQHADFFTSGAVAILAEVRAFVRRNPNPFPELELYPRLERLDRRLRPHVTRTRARATALRWRARWRLERLLRAALRPLCSRSTS